MSPELEELYRFIRQQEDDTSTGMEAMGGWQADRALPLCMDGMKEA